MIRDRLKRAARKIALRAFNMEEQAADRTTTPASEGAGTPYDPSVIPKIVEGDGDTPGPNHKSRIGRTWLSAQVISGDAGLLIDVRPPEEYASGHITGAILAPGDQIKHRTSLLPDQSVRVTIYDADGGELSHELATWLRAEGWGWGRQLQGGWAEWLEHGEPNTTPPEIPGALSIGAPATLADGRSGVVQAVSAGPPICYDVLLPDGLLVEGVAADALA